MSEVAYMEEETHSGALKLKSWRRIGHLIYPHRWKFLPLSGFSIALSLTEIGMTLIMREMIDEVIEQSRANVLIGYGVGYLVLGVLIAVSVMGLILVAGRIATGLMYDIRRAGFQRLQELEFAYYDRRSVGWLMTRLTSDCDKLSNIMVWFTVDMVWGSLLIVACCAVMFWMDWQVALVVTLMVPALAVAARYFQVKILGVSREMSRINSLLTASHNENITGVMTTKTLAREEQNLEEFGIENSNMYQYSTRHGVLTAAFVPVIMTICGMGVAGALWVGGGRAIQEEMSLGTLIAFMSFAMLLSQPVQAMARNAAEMLRAQAAVERVADLIEHEPGIKDSASVRERMAGTHKAGLAVDGYSDDIQSIEYKHVTFAYDQSKIVLDDFSLQVNAGETIALVGPTGGGKSTIVNLLARFYEPSSGSISVDGVDYQDRSLHWYQSQFGIVLQQPHLFSGSILDNIRYGRKDASVKAVKVAASLVHADQFIESLEDGYETQVGEGGVRLSGGQKQLISIARAVLTDPRVFIMDEATSSIDSETEKLIQAGIESVMLNRISFVIAHRLSTIRHADRILFIEAGKIVEQGDHAALMRERGRYYELYTGQFQREISLNQDG